MQRHEITLQFAESIKLNLKVSGELLNCVRMLKMDRVISFRFSGQHLQAIERV